MLRMQQEYRKNLIDTIVSFNKPATFRETDAGKNGLPFHKIRAKEMTNLTKMLKDDKTSLDFVSSVGQIAEKGILGYKPIFDIIMNASGNPNSIMVKRAVTEPETQMVDDYLKLSPSLGKDFSSDLITHSISSHRNNSIDGYIKNRECYLKIASLNIDCNLLNSIV